jgi:uncharacterized damage-inducible protein DinB
VDAATVQLLVDHLYWVNHRLLDAAARLEPATFASSPTVASRDLRATLVHELDVEWSWRMALEGRPAEEWGSDAELVADDFPDVATLRDRWATDEAEMRAWLATLSDDDLAATVHPGLSRTARPLWQFVVHIVTHGAHQQADAAALLTAAGASPGEIGFLEYLGVTERGSA